MLNFPKPLADKITNVSIRPKVRGICTYGLTLSNSFRHNTSSLETELNNHKTAYNTENYSDEAE